MESPEAKLRFEIYQFKSGKFDYFLISVLQLLEVH